MYFYVSGIHYGLDKKLQNIREANTKQNLCTKLNYQYRKNFGTVLLYCTGKKFSVAYDTVRRGIQANATNCNCGN
jgi:hypothetical protein